MYIYAAQMHACMHACVACSKLQNVPPCSWLLGRCVACANVMSGAIGWFVSVESRPTTADELMDTRFRIHYSECVSTSTRFPFIVDPVHGAVRGRSLSVLSALNTSVSFRCGQGLEFGGWDRYSSRHERWWRPDLRKLDEFSAHCCGRHGFQISKG